MTNTPTSKEKNPQSNVTTQKRHQKLRLHCYLDRARTVSWGNDSQTTFVAKPVYGIPTFTLTAKAV